MTEVKDSIVHADMVGKTIASVTESDVTMRDTYGDEFTVTRTVITFTDDSTTTFGDVQMDLYETDEDEDEADLCVNCGEPVRVDDNGAGGTVIVHEFGSTVCHDDPPGSHEDGDTTTVAELPTA